MSDYDRFDYRDRFNFHVGDLEEITDPDEIRELHKKSGFVPLSEEEQNYITNEFIRHYDEGKPVSTDYLREEYARKKAAGEL